MTDLSTFESWMLFHPLSSVFLTVLFSYVVYFAFVRISRKRSAYWRAGVLVAGQPIHSIREYLAEWVVDPLVLVKAKLPWKVLSTLAVVMAFDVLYLGSAEKWRDAPLLTGHVTDIVRGSLLGGVTLLGFILTSIVFLKSTLETGSILLEGSRLYGKMGEVFPRVRATLRRLKQLGFESDDLSNARSLLSEKDKFLGPASQLLTNLHSLKGQPFRESFWAVKELAGNLNALAVRVNLVRDELVESKAKVISSDKVVSKNLANLSSLLRDLDRELTAYRRIVGLWRGGRIRMLVLLLVSLFIVALFLLGAPPQSDEFEAVKLVELAYIGLLTYGVISTGDLVLFILRS